MPKLNNFTEYSLKNGPKNRKIFLNLDTKNKTSKEQT